MDKKYAIGIDLGTTYSCVGWWRDNRCEIISNDQGNRTTPSYVAFTDTERLIGDGAKNQSTQNPENTVNQNCLTRAGIPGAGPTSVETSVETSLGTTVEASLETGQRLWKLR